jgi:hypothetical protein
MTSKTVKKTAKNKFSHRRILVRLYTSYFSMLEHMFFVTLVDGQTFGLDFYSPGLTCESYSILTIPVDDHQDPKEGDSSSTNDS